MRRRRSRTSHDAVLDDGVGVAAFVVDAVVTGRSSPLRTWPSGRWWPRRRDDDAGSRAGEVLGEDSIGGDDLSTGRDRRYPCLDALAGGAGEQGGLAVGWVVVAAGEVGAAARFEPSTVPCPMPSEPPPWKP